MNKVHKDNIVYVSGGLFGDFIHQLSVINENYIKSGKKGILYIANDIGGDNFTYGLQKAYNDTYSLLSTQSYIKEYKIYNNEPYDINLTDWRRSSLLYKTNFYVMYKSIYSIEWGTHKWLDTEKNEKWKDIILINYSIKRPIININYKELYEKYGDKLLFISFSNQDYNHFIENSKINIPLYVPETFDDLIIAINSCKLFIGGLSAPLALAYAMHKDCIVGLSGAEIDNIHHYNLNTYIPNIQLN
jgi:ADP-heptose:LPS heptosyltransferase